MAGFWQRCPAGGVMIFTGWTGCPYVSRRRFPISGFPPVVSSGGYFPDGIVAGRFVGGWTRFIPAERMNATGKRKSPIRQPDGRRTISRQENGFQVSYGMILPVCLYSGCPFRRWGDGFFHDGNRQYFSVMSGYAGRLFQIRWCRNVRTASGAVFSRAGRTGW